MEQFVNEAFASATSSSESGSGRGAPMSGATSSFAAPPEPQPEPPPVAITGAAKKRRDRKARNDPASLLAYQHQKRLASALIGNTAFGLILRGPGGPPDLLGQINSLVLPAVPFSVPARSACLTWSAF